MTPIPYMTAWLSYMNAHPDPIWVDDVMIAQATLAELLPLSLHPEGQQAPILVRAEVEDCLGWCSANLACLRQAEAVLRSALLAWDRVAAAVPGNANVLLLQDTLRAFLQAPRTPQDWGILSARLCDEILPARVTTGLNPTTDGVVGDRLAFDE